MRHAKAIAAAAFIAATVAWPGTARADDGPVLVDDDYAVELTFDDDAATASITLINTSATDLYVVAVPTDTKAQCRPVDAPVSVPKHTQQSISVRFTGCSEADVAGSQFTIARADNKAALFPTITATPTSTKIDWSPLKWFWIAAIVGAVVLIPTWIGWAARYQRWNPVQGLPGLEASWTFKESWASNATVIAAAFTAVFGATGVATPILGETDAKKVLTIVGVAAAAALGLAGVAPLLLQSLRTWSNSRVTPLGLVLAGIVTIAATGGELGVVVDAVRATELLTGHDWPVLAGLIGAGLLAVYAVSATVQNLVTGKTEPPTEPKPTTLKTVLDIIFKHTLREAVLSPDLSLGNVAPGTPPAPTSAPADHPDDLTIVAPPGAPRRRTAIL